jgi:hypothetical protein
MPPASSALPATPTTSPGSGPDESCPERADPKRASRTARAALGQAERLGPATLTKIREWVGHSAVTITPVLDSSRTDSVDAHDPPSWMREIVVQRDQHCVFPGAPAMPAASTSTTSPPTTPAGQLARPNPTTSPLCRRHHRAKTHARWRYQRTTDGTYQSHDDQSRDEQGLD